jgi:hypothetical protein
MEAGQGTVDSEEQQDMMARMMSKFGNEMMKKMRLEFGQADKAEATAGGKQSSKAGGNVAGQNIRIGMQLSMAKEE